MFYSQLCLQLLGQCLAFIVCSTNIGYMFEGQKESKGSDWLKQDVKLTLR